MVTYRNTKTGRLLERPSTDEWLEASAGWERVDELCDFVPGPDILGQDDDDEGSKD